MQLFTAVVINLLLWGCESWTLTAGQRNNLNVRFNSWVRAMSRMTKLDLRTHSIRYEDLRKRLGIESFDEILERRCMNWMEKVAKMPGTLDDNRLPHVNYLVLGALEVREDQVANWKFFEILS